MRGPAVALVLAGLVHAATSQALGFLSTTYASTRWNHTVNGRLIAAPRLSPDGSVVYACYNGPLANEVGVVNTTGILIAAQASSGQLLWNFVNPFRQPFPERSECPSLLGNHPVVVSDSPEQREARFFVVDSATGTEIGADCSGLGASSDWGSGGASALTHLGCYHTRSDVKCEFLDPDDEEQAGQICNYRIPLRSSVTPVVHAGLRVVLAPSSDQHLYAINVATGRLQPFNVTCPQEHYTSQYTNGTRRLVGACTSHAANVRGTPDGSLVMGSDALRKKITDDCRTHLPAQPIETCPGMLFCSPVPTPAVLSHDQLTAYIVTAFGEVYALNTAAEPITVRWQAYLDLNDTRATLHPTVLHPPVVAPSGLIVVFGGSYVYALHPNGTLAWPAPFRTDATVVFGAEPAANGSMYPTRNTLISVFVSPVAADNVVYARDDWGVVYALHPASGALLFRFHAGRITYSPPVLGLPGTPSEHIAFVASRRGTLFALDCPPGSQFVVDRQPYLCDDLRIVVPSQRDLCEELERKCPPLD